MFFEVDVLLLRFGVLSVFLDLLSHFRICCNVFFVFFLLWLLCFCHVSRFAVAFCIRDFFYDLLAGFFVVAFF